MPVVPIFPGLRVGFCRRFSAWVRLGIGASGLWLAGQLPAQPAAAPVAGGEVITNAQVFWGLSNDEKQKPHQVRFELVVYYYDPFWQLIWGMCDNVASFLPVRGEPLPIKTGQRVRIEGTVQPGRGILRSEVTVTVLEENALPEPIPTRGQLAKLDLLDAQWSSLEGYVCQQREVDPTHIEYQVLSEGWLVTVRLLVNSNEAVAQLVNNRVRFNGVYVGAKDASQKLQRIDYWVPRPTDIVVLGELAEDPRFQLAPTALDRLPADGAVEWVRIEGEVTAFKSGESLTIRDNTGQLTVPTPQPGSLKLGDQIELVGRPSGSGLNIALREAHFRPKANRSGPEKYPGAGNAPRLNLRAVGQIMELPLSEVARGYSVTLRGVVTWSDPNGYLFYLQDATGGICVRQTDKGGMPNIQDAVEVRGVTEPGRYAPEVRRQEVTPLGPISMPDARLVTLEQALTGAEEARWVELRGYLRQVGSEANWSRLDLTTSFGEFSAYLPADQSLQELTGAMVRIAGVCSAEANSHRQLTGIRLWVQGKAAVVVEEPPPADPFAAPRYTIAGLNQFTGGSTLNRRVTLTGLVLMHIPGRYLLLQDNEAGLMVFSRETKPLAPGAAVEISGFPGREGSRPVLREAIARPASNGTPLQPYPCTHLSEVKPELDVHLVQVQGILTQTVTRAQLVRLTLQAEGVLFDAVLDQGAGWQIPEHGSQLELTGVYLLEFDEYHQPRGFRIQLRSPGDVRVLSTPPWWTAGRAIGVIGGLTACIALGVVWVALLRRRVQEQTEELRRHMEKEVRMQAEIERSSRLDSLGVLAGGIAHDFNNLLTAIMGNLGLMRLEEPAMQLVGPLVDSAERATKRASEVTQQLLTFAKGGDPVRAAVDLQEIVREAADFVQHGSNVKVEFEFEPGVPPANVDASQISRVVHNLVLNAVQAMPAGGMVRLALRAQTLPAGAVPPLSAGSYLQLTIADTGPGIAPDRLPRIFDPYSSTKVKGSGLGLATAHSIVKKHKGHISVESTVGQGTAFRIWLPAANVQQAVNTPAVKTVQPGAKARVLLMDDEESICKVGRAILRHAGHETTVVHDGAAAVEAFLEARKAERPFDVVIFDLTIPGGMGGREAAAELNQIDSTVRIVASSGYSHDPVMASHRSFGFSAVLPKPYNPEALVQIVDQVRQQ